MKRTIVTISILSLTLLGAACTKKSSPITKQNTTKKFFSTLTKNSWCNRDEIKGDHSGLAPTSRTFSFRSDGAYDYSFFSDYPEGAGSGHWSMKATGQNTAVLFLDSGSAYFAALEKGKLRLPLFTLGPCDPFKNTTSVDTVPPVAPSSSYLHLVNRNWKKISGTDIPNNPDAFTPTSILFHEDGTYDGIFRNGECQHQGEWSLIAPDITFSPHDPVQLVRRIPTKSCDNRGASGITSVSTLVYDLTINGDTISFEGSTYQATP